MESEKGTKKKSYKAAKIIAAVLALTTVIVVVGAVVLYVRWIPMLVQNPKVIKYVQKEVTKTLKADLEIKNPAIVTHFSPEIEFSVDGIYLTKEGKKLLDIENLDGAISFAQLYNKKIVLKRLIFDNVFADVNKIMELTEEEEKKEPEKTDWDFAWTEAELGLKKFSILYAPNEETSLKISGYDVNAAEADGRKYVHFNVLADITRNKKSLQLKFVDNNKVYIKDRKLFLDDFSFDINKSKILVNSVADENSHFSAALNAKHFDVADAVELINSDLVVPNGSEMLSYFDNVKGHFNFNIDVKDSDINGRINLESVKLDIVPLNNLPVTATTGYVTIDNNQILIKDFAGYYGKSKDNKVTMEGRVKDYVKSVDTEIVIKGLATNELTKNYISKLANCKIELIGDAPTRLTVKSIYNKLDIEWIFYVKRENDILLEGSSFSPLHYDRALKADFHMENDLFTIKSIDYFIAQEMKRGMEIKPIISVTGNLDARDFSIKDIGFKITKPLPSEFLNLFVGEKTFKKGTVAGYLQYINTGKYPRIDGKLEMEGVRIPSQRLSIKKGVMTTDNNHISIDANGRFRKTDYHFDGNIDNKMILPIVVKDVNLKIENLDMNQMMASLEKQAQREKDKEPQPENHYGLKMPPASSNGEETDTPYVFMPNMIVVEKCNFKLDKGLYKEINFGNIDAQLTLDKDGNLDIFSNWFDFAEWISTLKVKCDLARFKYYILHGCKNVDVDLLGTSLLYLKKEITGKASALIELNTDEKFKMNGLIRFTVIDGTITKLGLVQYMLNVAALFRNPIVMVSPSTLVDLVNVPEGTFELIDGELNIKDNIVERMKIKSKSPQLSSFIAGRFNLETRDTSLRIYTKFSSKNKGAAGFLRNISLNRLAQKMSHSDKNDMNYYSAEISQLPEIQAKEEDCQIFLTKVEGDVEHNNFISSLKKIK